MNIDKKRPDIIFHDRDSHDSNFLVVEVKKNGTGDELDQDIGKIKSSWFNDPLNYKFGAVINLKSDKTWGKEVFENDKTSL